MMALQRMRIKANFPFASLSSYPLNLDYLFSPQIQILCSFLCNCMVGYLPGIPKLKSSKSEMIQIYELWIYEK